MRDRAIIRGGLAAALSVAAAACTSGGDADYRARPLPEMGAQNISPESVLYEQAVTAIDQRDYATALDDLQQAREKNPNSARVFNAFGVVYDKLGRFDLSTRYYAQAMALDPGSRTVAQNMAYSKVLQGLMDPQLASLEPQPPTQAPLDAQPLPGVPPVAAPTVPVVAEAIPQVAAAPKAPVGTLAQEHVFPSVNAPLRVAGTVDMESLRFADVNIALPEEVEQRAVRVAPPVQQVHLTQVPIERATPRTIMPAAAVAMPSPTVRVSFEDPVPTAPALRPLAVESSALPQPEPAAHVAPAYEAPSVSLLAGAVDIAGLPAIAELTEADSPKEAKLAPVPTPPRPEQVARLMPAASLPARVVDPRPAAPMASPTPVIAERRSWSINAPLRIVNATGQPGTTDPVYRSLAALGWSMSRFRPVSSEGLKFTTIVYPVVKAPLAEALARTLPFAVRLEPDTCACRGMQVFLGSDFLAWNPSGRHIPSVWRVSLAAMATNKGVP